MTRAKDHDVLIVGGGLVGMTLAIALRNAGWNAALIEAGMPPEAPIPGDEYDLRVSAVSPASRQWLHQCGVWEALDHGRICAYRAMHVWASGLVGSLHFDANQVGVPSLGHIVENRAMLAAAWSLGDGEHVYCPARLADLSVERDCVRAKLEDGRILRASLIVGADGGQSRTRDLVGLNGSGKTYGQRGLVCVVATAEGHEHTAWQRFMPGGPLALLPLANGRISIVWSAPEERVRELEAMPQKLFHAHLYQASQGMLGDVVDSGPRASFPLHMLNVPRPVSRRAALVGDAAHVIHPLAGQGVNLGFMDAQALSRVLSGGLGKATDRIDPGTWRLLRRYARARKSDNLAMLAVTDGLHRLFTSSQPLVRMVRGPGLSMVNIVKPARNLLVKQALGGVTQP